MSNKCYTFAVSKDIIKAHSNTNISEYVREAIRYSFDLKCYKLIHSPETELLFNSAKHRPISVRLSSDDLKKIKKISKNLSDTIDNMLKLYEIIQTKGYSDDDVRKLNERISLKSPPEPDCPKITGDIIAKKTKRIKLRLPKGNGTQTITAK